MAIIDYVSCVFKEGREDEVRSLVDRFVPTWTAARGAHGYQCCWSAEGFRVYYAGGQGMGVYLQISGAGCIIVRDTCGESGFSDLLSRLRSGGGRATRLDIAFDTSDVRVTVGECKRAFLASECVTHLRRFKETYERTEDRVTVDMLHLGGIESETSLCIYDKQLEQIARGRGDVGHCVRFEVRYRGKRAEEVWSWIMEREGLEGASGLLSSVIEFKIPSPDSDKRNWLRRPWWVSVISGSSKVRLLRSRVQRSLVERAATWVRLHAPTLAMLTLALCNGKLDGPWLRNCLGVGWQNMKPEQEAVVRGALGKLPVNVNPRYKGLREV